MGGRIYVEQYTPKMYTVHKNGVQTRRISFIRYLFLKLCGSKDIKVLR